MKADWLSIGDLRTLANHPRKLKPSHVRRIARSIEQLGWVNAIIVDEHNAVIAGYGRWEAAKHLGLDKVPIIRVNGMTDAQKRAYRISENKLAEKGEWDTELLAAEFTLLIDNDFEIELTGFDMAEIDMLLEIDGEPGEVVTLPAPDTPAISRRGDIWQVGPHRVICGDSTNSDDYAALLDGVVADIVFTDPPYNVPIAGNAAGIRKAAHREFAMASGEMTDVEFREFLTTVVARMTAVSRAGAIIYVCMDWRHMLDVLGASVAAGLEHKQLVVWNKTNFGMGSFYRSQHELVFVFKKAGPHTNNIGLSGRGEKRTNVWTYPGANGFRKGRFEDLDNHPTVKPVKMVADAIMDCSKRGDLVLDPFVGSGTTLVAAHQTGRRCYALEIDPLYVDCAVGRLMNEFDLPAVLVGSGEAFSEVALARIDGGKK